MKTRNPYSVAALALFSLTANAQVPVQTSLRPLGRQVELRWPARLAVGDRNLYPAYRVDSSADLRNWVASGQLLRGSGQDANQVLTQVFDGGAPHAFFRLIPQLEALADSTASGGADVFGYDGAFAQALQQIGQITPGEFAARYPNHAAYLNGISWDPTTASYWELFNTNPEVYNRGLLEGVDDLRRHDFRLSAQELALFKKNGFVAFERSETESFADAFYDLWEDDLPVFISADAILQAWHRSYDSMLEELEETLLSSALENILNGMAGKLPAAWSAFGDGTLRESLLDADYFITVARSLLAGERTASSLNQDDRVAATLTAVAAEELDSFNLFGTCRTVDFSQFKIRGHYENSERLGRYFKAMMWCGRVDLRVAGGPFRDCEGFRFASPREMGTAVVLHQLLSESGQFPQWLQFERVIQTFVGWTDSMTFAQLGDLLTAAGMRSLADLPNREALEALQRRIEDGDLGYQQIRSDYYVSPLGGGQMKLPRSFTVFGQKFVLDSWALGKLVYDDIIWDEDGVLTEADKVKRRVPSGLDIAFSVLGNNQVVPDLVARITNTAARQSNNHMVRFRDGLPYQHNLAAVREVVESQDRSAWEQNIYTEWLGTLRELSAPTTDSKYPEAMRTRAWAMKSLNTQMASWTHLRHDTLLYSKPTYTGIGECFYPEGFVEPVPLFWERLKGMAERTAGFLEKLQVSGSVVVATRQRWQGPLQPPFEEISLVQVQTNQVAFMRRFAATAGTLKRMAEMELAQRPFGIEEELFIRNLVEDVGFERAGCGGFRRYGGWYPQLFYQSSVQPDFLFHQDYGSDKWDAVVVDVHTDLPDPLTGDPGSVLHQGVGRALMLMIAVDNGSDRMVYAGPVLSHYEFEIVGPPQRLSDEEWRGRTWVRDFPAPPEWTKSYLIPMPR
jgi:hypothetical protein